MTAIANRVLIYVFIGSALASGEAVILLYVVVSVVTGIAVFAVGDSLCSSRRNPARWALIAALLWPVLLIGLAQLLVVMAAGRILPDHKTNRLSRR